MSIYADVMAAEELINNCYDPETGEVFEDQQLEVQGWKEKIMAQGLEKLCKVRANFLAEVDSFKAEEKRLAEKRKRIESKVAGVEKYIKEIFDFQDQDKVKAGTFTISYRMSEAVELSDDFSNAEYGKFEFKADKTAIKKALKSGEKIDGADIISRLNLQIK